LKGMIPLEEKFYELMTKMYSETQNGFKQLRNEMQDGFYGLKQGQVKLENELKEAKSALFDGYNQTYEKLEIIEKKFDKLDAIVEDHDLAIKALRRAK